ncbi:MAG: AI-2E family transporter [Verrucomicrobia bacterium]|nr:AI-2E family transporter [Verrucomicrobiota bacterium]MBV9657433.1 AI-2E family transporter [Verrucomicrobiota bacterium]
MHNLPTVWQRRVLWGAATFLAFAGAGAVAVWLITLLARAVAFLQPVLIPFAIAGVLAFLLEPLVRFIETRTRLSRRLAVVVLFVVVGLATALLGVWLVPRVYRGTADMVRDLPDFAQKAQKQLTTLFEASQKKLEHLSRLLPAPSPTPTPDASPPAASPSAENDNNESGGNANASPAPLNNNTFDAGDVRDWLQEQLPALTRQIPLLLQRGGRVLLGGLGGFLGVFGVLLNAIIIPIYLYFLLVEGRNIARRWSDYLPVRDSPLKQEIVSVLVEINGYLIAFFRGQLIVSTIDGILIGTSLWVFVHLNFSLFIALLVIVLTFIPYLGIVLCYVPAILVALVQYGDVWHPLYVVIIMFTVQMLEGYIIAPKIVGESTGLHPLTIIVSVFGWSLLLEGPIGAILAVPLTASLKVLMRRYVWERARARARLLPIERVEPVLRAGNRDIHGDGAPALKAVPEVVAHPPANPAPAPAASAPVSPPKGPG